MSLIDDIKRDRERPQVKLMSMSAWYAKSDVPAPGWVKVVGPCVATQCPTLATNLDGEDYIARHADARRIARVPDMEAALLAAEDLAYRMDQVLADLTTHGGYTYEDDFKDEVAALAAYRKATGEADQ